jgi:hypothetical protein
MDLRPILIGGLGCDNSIYNTKFKESLYVELVFAL